MTTREHLCIFRPKHPSWKTKSSSAIVILRYFLTILRGGEHNGGRPALSRVGPSSLYPDRVESGIHVRNITAADITTGPGAQYLQVAKRARGTLPPLHVPREKRNDPAVGRNGRSRSLITCEIPLPDSSHVSDRAATFSTARFPFSAPMVYLRSDVNPNFSDVRVAR